MEGMQPRYRSLSSWLKHEFGEAVRKISLDAGLVCPNRDGSLSSSGCIYCNPRGSGTAAHAKGLSISEQVDRGIEFLSHRFGCHKFIAYFQSYTNTYAPAADLARVYAEALQNPQVIGLAVGTRPDCVPDDVLDLLAAIGKERLVWVEYGLQSIHSRTLQLINRQHGPEAFLDAVRRSIQRDIKVVAHLILGLPGESIEDMRETARSVAAAGVWGVKLHPLYVVKGTGLEHMYREGAFRPFTEEQALEATQAVLEVLPPAILIHRLTSDPHREELVAPTWMIDKRGVRARLDRFLRDNHVRQGSRIEDSAVPELNGDRGVQGVKK